MRRAGALKGRRPIGRLPSAAERESHPPESKGQRGHPDVARQYLMEP